MTNNLELFKNHLYKLIKEELEGGEEEKQAGLEKVLYDLVLEPANLESALAALQNSKNYGIYSKNLTDRNEYNSIFGPSNPPQKTNAAWKDWDSMFPKSGASEDQIDSLLNKRLWKIEDDIREHERNKNFDEEFIQLARNVYITNDIRATIKKEINLKYNTIHKLK